MATYGDKIVISGFGNDGVNGSYSYSGEFNGYPAYQKGIYSLLYYQKRGPWCELASYYISKRCQIQGSVSISKPLYRVAGTNAAATTGWESLEPSTSGENTTGTTVFDEGSSSSSTSMSSSSSSSSTSMSSSSSSSSTSSSSSSIDSSSTSMSSSSSSSSTSESSSSSSSSTSESSSSSSSSTSMSSSSSSSSTSESSSSSSSTSMSSSSSSTSMSTSSSSSSDFCVLFECINLSGNMCPRFSNWTLYGVNSHTSTNGSMYTKLNNNGGLYTMYIYSDVARTNLVGYAQYTGSVSGGWRLSDSYPVTGTVYYTQGDITHGSLARLECINESSSSSSSSTSMSSSSSSSSSTSMSSGSSSSSIDSSSSSSSTSESSSSSSSTSESSSSSSSTSESSSSSSESGSMSSEY